MTLKRIDKLLNSKGDNALENLVHRAQDMDDLAATLRQALTDMAPEQILAANLRENGELVVVCGSSAWAARVRFESDRLIRAARRGGYAAETCRIRVGRQT